jgi:hypothetical protein
VLESGEEAIHAETLQTLRRRLDRGVLEAAWAAGRDLSLDATVAEGLAVARLALSER